MVVILFCSTLATVVYLNILQSQNTAQKLKAYYLAGEMLLETTTKRNYLDLKINVGDFAVDKVCKPYRGNELLEVTIVIKSTGGKLLWQQSDILANE